MSKKPFQFLENPIFHNCAVYARYFLSIKVNVSHCTEEYSERCQTSKIEFFAQIATELFKFEYIIGSEIMKEFFLK